MTVISDRVRKERAQRLNWNWRLRGEVELKHPRPK